MNNPRTRNWRHILSVIAVFILLTIVGLWSWNTLAELFSLPAAKYKHVLAVTGLLFLVRLAMTWPGHQPRQHTHELKEG